jgi:hypothetical protein
MPQCQSGLVLLGYEPGGCRGIRKVFDDAGVPALCSTSASQFDE